MDSSRLFPVFVFPLTEIVFYPATSKPLNIVEPRYVKMVHDAIEHNQLIALAFSDSTQASSETGQMLLNVRRTAGVGRPILLEKRPDGTMLILLEAVGKAYLHERLESDEPYMTCMAKWVSEQSDLLEENRFLLNRLTKDLGGWLTQHLEGRGQAEQFLKRIQTPEEKVNYLCSFMIQSAETKQRLLETDNINDRIRAASEILFQQSPTSH